MSENSVPTFPCSQDKSACSSSVSYMLMCDFDLEESNRRKQFVCEVSMAADLTGSPGNLLLLWI